MIVESSSTTATESEKRPSKIKWRLWALVPILLLVATVSVFAAVGGSLIDLVGTNPPPADEFEIRRVEFKPGEIRVRVTNPQREDLTIAGAAVDDAIVNFELDGPRTLGRLGSSTVVIPFFWVDDDPYVIGITSSSGIETAIDIPAAVESEGATAEGWLGYAIIGFLVGIVPVALGVAWLPSLRHLSLKWISAFMAVVIGSIGSLTLWSIWEREEVPTVHEKR